LPTGASQGSYPRRSRPLLSPAVGPGPPPPLPEDARVVFRSFRLNFSKSRDPGFGPGPASGAGRSLLHLPLRVNRFFTPVTGRASSSFRILTGSRRAVNFFFGRSAARVSCRVTVRPGILPPGSRGVNPFFSGLLRQEAVYRQGCYSLALGILPPFPDPRQPLF